MPNCAGNVHVKKKREELGLNTNACTGLWEGGRLVLNKLTLKPVWTYGIQLWGCMKPRNIAIIQTLQNKVLRILVDAPWYIRNADIHTDLHMEMVTAKIGSLGSMKGDFFAMTLKRSSF
jgi:hypothetical protein